MNRRIVTLALCLTAALAAPAQAPLWAKDAKPAKQGGGVDLNSGNAGRPLEVYADQGLELSQDSKAIIARGNAKAIRGNVTVTADTLTARYRDKAKDASAPAKKADKTADKTAQGGAQGGTGSSEIYQVDADGHATIASPTQTVYGDHAVYNIDTANVLVTGHDLRLVTPTDLVTARDSLEYWEEKQQAVARGNALAKRGEKTIQADLLTADFAKNDQGQLAITKAHGIDHVKLVTAKETVTGDKGDYDVESGIVIVTGSVHITRDESQLDGQYAVVNLNTGISRLYPTIPGAAGGGSQRVKGVFVPKSKDDETETAPGKALR